ncbi:hypothetical protein SAMN02799624_05211 [Paenibacillus sp. UNC496MF]|uniref:Ig-like domain-containing protein n=1 Tax=Paenibacillus sp. UNC496MF TaxID=1502753 RepID=UPI0008F04FCC|nr:Ig-like domain-containing protein [Paenibacillus sp. UNC496MF]SFJ62157.1 hypothetical protein SAMN02799624_05211 [Paenibacillus sp. UNC496MF]
MVNIPIENYLPPSVYGMTGTISVETADGTRMTLDQAKAAGVKARKLVFKPRDGFLYNTTYTVVAQKSIKSESGLSLGDTARQTFTSQYGPLFGDQAIEVHGIMKSLYEYFTIHEVYAALRDAGQKAYILLNMFPDVNNARFRELLDSRIEYFGVTRYVPYEAAKMLLGTLYIRLSEKMNLGDPTVAIANESTATLGDLTIQEKTDPQVIGSGVLKVIQNMMSEVERECKYWMDHLMNRDRRGYTTPLSASFRKNTATPDDRGGF